MDRIAKALATHDDAFAEIAHVLFGDGADELIEKFSPEGSDLSASARRKKAERTQAKIGLASNVVGLAAGIAGTGAALRDERFSDPKAPRALKAVARAGSKIPKPLSGKTGKAGALLAGGALGLQATNIAGDVVANRVLARSANDGKKKPKKEIKKSDGSILTVKDLKDPTTIKNKVIVRSAQKSAPIVIQAGKNGGKKLSAVAVEKTKIAIGKKADFSTPAREEMDIVWAGEISKVDDDKRQVFGFASVVKLNDEDVIDKQGDYISIEEVEKAAYDYVHKSRKGGDMHERDGLGPRHVSDMIESMVFTPEKISKMGLPDDFPQAWWVGYQIHDDETWNLVKSGKRQMFSIHGKGSRVSKVL